MSQVITVQGRTAVIADGLPARGWSWNRKGYLFYSSRRKGWIKRGAFAARLAWELAAGRPLPDGHHVHHQTFDKARNDGPDLIALDPLLNPTPERRCPHTGQYLSRAQWERRYGIEAGA